MKRGVEKPLQKKIEYVNWAVLGILLILSGLWTTFNFTLGILFGGFISILNFYGLGHSLKAAFGQMETGGIVKSALIFKYLLRLALTGLVLYLVLVKTAASIFGLFIGLSTVVISIVLAVVFTSIDKSYLKEV